MNKNVLAVLVTVVALGAIGGIVYVVQNGDDTDTASSSQQTTPSTSTPSTTQTESHNSANPLGTQPDQSTSDVQSGTVAMDIKNFAFAQKNLKVKKGTTVTWTNRDSDRHDVAPDEESAAFQGSELLRQGESYSFTFNTVGTYSYHCSPHPYMKGTVEVVE